MLWRHQDSKTMATTVRWRHVGSKTTVKTVVWRHQGSKTRIKTVRSQHQGGQPWKKRVLLHCFWASFCGADRGKYKD